MATTFEIAPEEVAARALAIIEKFHPDLLAAKVSIDYLFAHSSTGQPLKHSGYPALAIARIVNLKDRVKGLADAEISIDAERFDEMTDEEKDGLLDHELTHLCPIKDADGEYKRDSHHRPRLSMQRHDYQFGWFREVALRHGRNSPECVQARILYEKDGQAFFPLLTGTLELEAT